MLPRHSHDALYEGFVLLDCLVDGEDCPYILHHGTSRDGEGSALDLLAKYSINKLLFSPPEDTEPLGA